MYVCHSPVLCHNIRFIHVCHVHIYTQVGVKLIVSKADPNQLTAAEEHVENQKKKAKERSKKVLLMAGVAGAGTDSSASIQKVRPDAADLHVYEFSLRNSHAMYQPRIPTTHTHTYLLQHTHR